MNELSLFTGAGGGLLGTHLLGWRPVGYVEWDDYCQRVIAARIRDGYLPAAPIFTDVREFAQSGAADQYRGIADVVTAGFPCQPFSIAGRQRAEGDERNMWPATADVIRRVRPKCVLLENVPGLLTCGYAGVVLADLAAMGYVGRYGCISAADTGARHKRDRWWVVAYADEEGQLQQAIPRKEKRLGFDFSSENVADAIEARQQNGQGRRQIAALTRYGAADNRSRQGRGFGEWPPEPGVDRMVDGLSPGLDKRIAALGNAQVPRMVFAAFTLLSNQ